MPDRLDKYRAKRSADRTTEPFGQPGADRPRLYVIQKHAARRLHYDLRLELEGALRSWAVPRGPSLDPAEKRLAVEVEDHPVEYADFEGTIPADNYGAGTVIVWDLGSWTPVGDALEGLAAGKLLFDVAGYKIRGRYQLVRTKHNPKEWLLIKKPDAWARPEGEAPLSQASVLSGLTLEELREGRTLDEELGKEAARLDAARRAVDVRAVELMLAEVADRPFSGTDWLFELKYDGYRLLASREPDGKALLVYRRGSDASALYPDLARAVAALPVSRAVLDGEVVVLDDAGRPSFQRLQKRALLHRAADIERAAVDLPAHLMVFDLLGVGPWDLRALPLEERKRLLARLLPRAGPLRFADHVEAEGEALFAEVSERGLEGVIGKRRGSPYRAGRSSDWRKVRALRTGDFVVVGYSQGRGRRGELGAVHLAAWDGPTLVYAGKVGTGFTAKQLDALRGQLGDARVPKPPCQGAPKGAGNVWSEPALVMEVRYLEWTNDRQLRQPAFLRLRDDKPLHDCTAPATLADAPAPAPAPVEAVPRRLALSNQDKVFWPEEAYTKGDLVGFYRAIAPWLLPYLHDRPVVLTRYPDGIAGKSFFQKDAPSFVPGWVRTERIWSEHASREIDYFICDDVDMLTYVINMGSIPLHVWASRIAQLPRPDWCILDLDPKGAPFAHVVRVARSIQMLCDELALPAFLKTSGQAGLHVLVPLGGQMTYLECRTLGELMARTIADELPDIATTARAIGARGGRVYVDFLQNGHGRTIVSPFSVRPQPGAPVSTPLDWDELGPKLDPRRFTIKTVPIRMAKAGRDPMRPVLDARPDLPRALEALERRLRKTSKA